jgi:hypothetical protein
VLVLGALRCADLTAPTQVGNVSIVFSDPTRDTIRVVVGDTVSPVFNVLIGSQVQERARYVYSVITPNTRLRVIANGEAIEVMDRGIDTIYAKVVGVTVGGTTTGAKLLDTLYVISAPAANTVEFPAGSPANIATIASIGATRILNATSRSRQGVAVAGGKVRWYSMDPTILAVVPDSMGVTVGDTSRATIQSVNNGTTDILAIFEDIDTVRTTLTVTQQFAKFRFASSKSQGQFNMRFGSLTDTATVFVIPQDSQNTNFRAGANVSSVPTPTLRLSGPGSVTLAVTGTFQALMTSDDNGSVGLWADVAGVKRSDSVTVTVHQDAVSLTILGLRVDTIPSLGGTRGYNATALDSLGRGLPPDSISWSSTSSAIATIDLHGNPAVAAGLSVGTTTIKAVSGAQRDSVTLVVRNDPDKVALNPDTLRILSVDDTVSFSPPVVTNTRGTPLTGITVTLHSLDSTIAEPLSNGAVWGKRVGVTRIFAQTQAPNSKVDTSRVEVTNAPARIDIIPTSQTMTSVGDSIIAIGVDLFNSRNVALPRAAANWRSGNQNVARVTVDSSKTIIAAGVGDTYIYAYSPIDSLTVKDSVHVVVSNNTANLTTTPNTAQTLTAFGATIDFDATARNTAGNVIVGATITWSVVSGGAFLSIDPVTGVATALANGSATVRATSGGVNSADIPVTVAQAYSPARSTIIPAAASLIADGASNTLLTIQLRDANDNNLAFGGATVVPSTTLGTLGAVTDAGNGRYTVTLTTSVQAGTSITAVTVNAVAISGNGVVAFTPGPAARYVVTSNNSTPVAGTSVTIRAQLADANNNPVATDGNLVTFSSTNGGTFTPVSNQATTDGTGAAQITFNTSATVATHTITGTDGTFSGSSAPINSIAAGANNYLVTPATTSPVAGTPITITAQLRDGSGNPVALGGQAVTWTKSDLNGTFSSGGSSTTNASGVATITLTTHTVAGTATTVTATTTGPPAVAGTSVMITTVAGPPTQLTLTQAPSATAQSGIAFLVQPSVQLHDASGNPVSQSNVNITATIIAGGGVLTGATTVQTDGTGLAAFADLAIIGANGARTLQFSTSGASTTTASVTIAAGTATQIVPASSTSQSATVGNPVTSVPAVQVRDASNNPVANHPVTFDITSGSGTTTPISGTTINTDPSGIASLTSWTLGTTAGANAVTATAAGLAGSPVSFIATGTPDVVSAALTSVTRTGADNVLANGVASSTVSVTLRDQHGNPVPGKTVSLDDAGSTSLITPVSATSNASGQATFTVTNTTAETVTYTATANDPLAIVITQTAQVTFGNPIPTLGTISPTNANRTETLDVVFTGSGFVAGVSSVNVGPDLTVNTTTVNSPTQITANITIGFGAATGARNFSVTNPAPGGGTSNLQSFTISNPVPNTTGIAPASVVQGETAQVVITGTGFTAGATASFAPATDITINSTTVNSATQITLSVSFGAGAVTGARTVTVTNPAPGGGVSGAQTITINTPASPTLTNIAPNTADRLATINVVLTGSGFATGVSTVDFGADITVNSTTVDSPTQITANITTTAAAALGARNVTVTNTPAGGTSTAQTLTINNPAPTITTVVPSTVTVGLGGVTVATTTITGTGFVNNALDGTTVDFVQGDVTISGTVTINSPTQITVTNIDYPGTLLLPTSRTLRVTNTGQAPVTHTITLNP